jgi:plastocyanin domain-containing protein
MMIINIIGFAVIALIIWWFWFYKHPTAAITGAEFVITVEAGAYTPAHLTLAANTPATLIFLRKDAAPCAELVMFPQLDINQTLPFNEAISIDLPELKPGQYAFHCQMQMYRGVLNVE